MIEVLTPKSKSSKTGLASVDGLDLSSIPDDKILAEAQVRRERLRSKLGRWATLKKMKNCKGCGGSYSAREMRSHKCSVPVSQR